MKFPAAGIFLILGVLSGLASILALKDDLRDAFLLCLLAAVLTIVMIWLNLVLRRKKQLPDADLAPQPVYSLKNADEEDVKWIAELEKATYSAGDSVPETKLLEWHRRNPKGFFVILEDGNRIGHIDILPMRKGDPFFDQFLRGVIREIEIPGPSLALPNEKKAAKQLYVESVIINGGKRRGKQDVSALKFLLSQIVPLVKSVASLRCVKRVYAIAVTKSGKRLMEKLGFEILPGSGSRVDKHSLFCVSLPTLAKRIEMLLRHTVAGDRRDFERLLRKSVRSGL